MTPKEKAIELLDKFTFASIYFTNNTDGAKLNAKTCALIAVKEILKTCYLEKKWFYEEVKEEINKL